MAFVYFIRSGEAGPIKIGWSVNPRKRLAMLQTGCAETLTLMAIVGGQREDEQFFHAKWATHRAMRMMESLKCEVCADPFG